MSSLVPESAAPRFPILTFDERSLSPALGYVFDARWLDPHESIVSILWKFIKANALPGHVATSVLRADIDPYEGVEATRSAVDLRRLRTTLALPLKTLRGALIPPSLYKANSRFFRYCPRCLSRGYHCVAHQFETVRTCPLHKRTLEIECRGCGYMAPYLLNALLLGAPYRCGQCGSPSVMPAFSVARQRPLNKRDRITMCRLHYRQFYF